MTQHWGFINVLCDPRQVYAEKTPAATIQEHKEKLATQVRG